MKLPEAYTGEDDFDKMDNWLQGLLCYFKLNQLMLDDRDADCVLVMGHSLKGKAEWWFNHKVERPSQVICDWTFELVIIRIFRAFITTATAQQAVRKYAQVKYSQEEGITAFHHELLLWASRLAQYLDKYSFKWKLLNGLPLELHYHLALYEGVMAEHSTIMEIVSKGRHVEMTFNALKSGCKSDT